MDEIIFQLLNIPRRFAQESTVSIYDLLKETSYCNLGAQIYEQDIHNALMWLH